MSFPYKRDWTKDEDIYKMFEKLKSVDVKKRIYCRYYKIRNLNINPLHLLYRGIPTLFIIKKTDYEDHEQLSDMFQEECRMKCKKKNKPSPYDFFNNNKQKVINHSMNKYGKQTPYYIRESIYNLVKECESFKPLNLVFVIKMLKSTKMLDFSAGWGDRLIGAMACDIHYCGIDPNTCLHPNYERMIDFFNYDREKIKLINKPVEEVDLPNEFFDLVFTSPPYFDLEIYTEEKTQSVESYSNEKSWFDNFLKVAIEKSWNALMKDGYLVLVINQRNKMENYVEWMIDYIYNTFNDSHYYGVISYAKEDMKNPQPMFIWKKSVKVPNELYNPPVIIKSVEYENKTFNIFRDDYLIGGTKQRAVIPYIEQSNKKEFVYAGPIYGYAQIALSYGVKLTRRKGTLFVEKTEHLYPFTKYAYSFGNTEIIQVPKPNHLKIVQEKAKIYSEKLSGVQLLSFGLNDDTYKRLFYENLKKAMPKHLLENNPKRLWLVAGSATILNVLAKIFTKTFFLVVQVGKKIWPDQLIEGRSKLYISDEKFANVAINQPPYQSVSTYDAKLWKYVMKYGKTGDYIWNVGKDINEEYI